MNRLVRNGGFLRLEVLVAHILCRRCSGRNPHSRPCYAFRLESALRLKQIEMKKPFRLLLRQATYNLRGGFLVRPLAIALALGCVGAMLSWLEETFPVFSDIVPRALFPSTPIRKWRNSFWAASRRPS
jgi:hypothetical protein